jgi:hypothetical protein
MFESDVRTCSGNSVSDCDTGDVQLLCCCAAGFSLRSVGCVRVRISLPRGNVDHGRLSTAGPLATISAFTIASFLVIASSLLSSTFKVQYQGDALTCLHCRSDRGGGGNTSEVQYVRLRTYPYVLYVRTTILYIV